MKGRHGNEGTLEHQLLAIGSQSLDSPLNIPLEDVFQLSQQPSIKLTPPEGSDFDAGEVRITLSLEVRGLPVSKSCGLHAQLVRNTESDLFALALVPPLVNVSAPNPKVNKTGLATWEVTESTAIKSGKYSLKYNTDRRCIEMVAEAVYYVCYPV